MIIDIPDERVKKIITDYLSDKEEDNLACCGGRVSEKDLSEYLSKAKEASKGECQHLHTKIVKCSHVVECEDCNQATGKFTRVSPPQQEESRGECGKDSELIMRNLNLAMMQLETGYEEMAYDLLRKTVKIIDEETDNPQLKEESPKQGPYDNAISTKEFKRSIKTCGIESPKEDEDIKEFRNQFINRWYSHECVINNDALDSLEDYIKANFVSKSKLSKYVQDGIDECNEPGMRIGGVAVLREMQMAFRLEDL